MCVVRPPMDILVTSLFAIACLLLGDASRAQDPAHLTVARELFQVGGPSHSLRYSPDGKLLASGGDRGEVVVLDAATGEVKNVFEASDHWVGGLRFSPDGRRLAVVGRSATLWDLTTGDQLAEAACSSPQALDWSRNGKFLAAVANNGEAVLLAAKDLSVLQRLPLAGSTAVDAIAIDATSSKVAIGKRSGDTLVYEAATGKLLDTLKQPDWVHGLAWLDDGRLLRLGWQGTLRGYGEADLALGAKGFSLAAQADGSRVLVTTSKNVAWFEAGKQPVHHAVTGPIALHPDGARWVVAEHGQFVVRRGAEVVRTLPGVHRQSPGDAVMTGDGRYAVVVGVKWANGTTQVFDVQTGERLAVAGFPTKGELVANSQGTEVAVHTSASDNAHDTARELQFWAILPGKPLKAHLVRKVPFAMTVRTANPDCPPSVLSPDLRYFGHSDQLIDLEDDSRSFRPNRILFSETHPAGLDYIVSRMSMHSHIAGASGRGVLHVFSRDGVEVHKQRLLCAPRGIAPTLDGLQLAVSLRDEVQLLTLPKLENVQTLPFRFRQLVWIDEHTLLGSGLGDQLTLVDVRTGKELQTLQLGSWARRIDYHRDRGIALITVQDRGLIVRVHPPKK